MRLVFAGVPDSGTAAPGTATTGGAGALMQLLFMLLIFFAMMYFLVILPQRRREKEYKQMLEAMKKGDTVITSGGIVGKVIDIKNDTIKIKSAVNTELVVHKAYIAKVVKQKDEEAGPATGSNDQNSD